MNINTYTKHTHEYKVSMIRMNQLTCLYNGDEEAQK